MISLITDFSLIMAESSAADNVPTGLIFLISLVAFIASTVIFGIYSYKIKLKKLRENKSDDDTDNQGG